MDSDDTTLESVENEQKRLKEELGRKSKNKEIQKIDQKNSKIQ